jgi:hypothetical protein
VARVVVRAHARIVCGSGRAAVRHCSGLSTVALRVHLWSWTHSSASLPELMHGRPSHAGVVVDALQCVLARACARWPFARSRGRGHTAVRPCQSSEAELYCGSSMTRTWRGSITNSLLSSSSRRLITSLPIFTLPNRSLKRLKLSVCALSFPLYTHITVCLSS